MEDIVWDRLRSDRKKPKRRGSRQEGSFVVIAVPDGKFSDEASRIAEGKRGVPFAITANTQQPATHNVHDTIVAPPCNNQTTARSEIR
jgi:hypothetical protein